MPFSVSRDFFVDGQGTRQVGPGLPHVAHLQLMCDWLSYWHQGATLDFPVPVWQANGLDPALWLMLPRRMVRITCTFRSIILPDKPPFGSVEELAKANERRVRLEKTERWECCSGRVPPHDALEYSLCYSLRLTHPRKDFPTQDPYFLFPLTNAQYVKCVRELAGLPSPVAAMTFELLPDNEAKP